MALRRVCRRHFEAAPQLDRLNLAALSLGHDALPIDEAPMDDWVGAVNLENPSVAHLRGPEAIRSENLIKIKLLVDFWRKI